MCILLRGAENLSHQPCFSQITRGNVLRHHNKHLMGNFEFLHSSRIISNPSPSSWLIRYNTHLPWRTHLPFKHTGTATIFKFGYQSCTWPHSGPFYWQKSCSGCNSTIDLVVLGYNFTQICSNTQQISWIQKIQKLCKPPCCCPHQSGHVPFFLQLFVSSNSAFACPIFVKHTCCSNVVNSKVGKQTKRCEIVIHKYIKTKSWSYVFDQQ